MAQRERDSREAPPPLPDLATSAAAARAPQAAADILRRLALIAATALALWLLGDVLLLVFAAALLAVALQAGAASVQRFVPLGHAAGLAFVSLGVVCAFMLIGWLSGPRLAEQGNALWDALFAAVQAARDWLDQFGWGRALLDSDAASAAPDREQVAVQVGNFLATVIGLAAGFVIMLATAVYFAAEPDYYLRGALRLLPRDRRERGAETFAALQQALRNWLLGQCITMAIIATCVYLGLSLLGVPLALLLGLIAGLTNFVPYIGPFVGAVPALLIAVAESPQLALWVAALFVGVQSLEGYLIEPLVQKRTTRLPPALTILSQTVLGTLFGPLGLILATPLLAAILVAVRMLYVEDVLGDRDAAQSGPALPHEP